MLVTCHKCFEIYFCSLLNYEFFCWKKQIKKHKNKEEKLSIIRKDTKTSFNSTIWEIKLFNPIQDEPCGRCSRIGVTKKTPSHSKIYQTYSLLIKLDKIIIHLKKMQIDTEIKWHNNWVLLTYPFFHWKSTIFVLSENTHINYILMHNFSFF